MNTEETPIRTITVCSACGTSVRFSEEKFCPVCNKLLSEDYQPLDSLRSSYGLQRQTLQMGEAGVVSAEQVFGVRRENNLAELSWACFVYSLVPYLGILFIPVTFLLGTAAGIASVRRDDRAGMRLGFGTVAGSLPVLAVQILLWWLLYLIPELGHVPSI
ncbi:MAG: hypothetical protein KF831_16810 [Acidobacteria bacterium]|nr:hypothetical protein [Acidobacteriota bacterium]